MVYLGDWLNEKFEALWTSSRGFWDSIGFMILGTTSEGGGRVCCLSYFTL